MNQVVYPLKNGYEARVLDLEAFKPLYEKYKTLLLSDSTQTFWLHDALSEAEIEASERLEKNLDDPFTLNLVIYKNNEFVGWYQNSCVTK